MGVIRTTGLGQVSPNTQAFNNITSGNTIATGTAGTVSPEIQAIIDNKAAILANQMVQSMNLQNQLASNGRVFTRFDMASDVVSNQKTFVTTGLFSGNAATMSVMYTGSLQTSTQKTYYYEVWDGTSAIAEPQFSITYGHRLGSGSSALGTLNDAPSRAIYSQYKLLLLNPGDTSFTFGDSTSSDSIYALNFNRARIRDKVDPGNWQFSVTNLSGSFVANNVHTGSNVKALKTKVITLIDDSGDAQETLNLQGGSGPVYNIVSGSITNGIYNATNPDYYGLVYPEMGVIVLNAEKLDTELSFNTVTGSNVAGDNSWKLYTAISGAMTISTIDHAFQARNEETVTSTHYFVRVKNGEYNFSNNPSFVTGSVGEFAQPTFIGDPKVYITTVGMYNDRQELLAVAKLSQPIQKSFSNEALIKVKLDF